MTEQEIIKKAKKVLDAIGLDYTDNEISVAHIEDKKLLEALDEVGDEYSVIFSYKLPDGREGIKSVIVDKKTHKLKYVITKSNMYEVPEELR